MEALLLIDFFFFFFFLQPEFQDDQYSLHGSYLLVKLSADSVFNEKKMQTTEINSFADMTLKKEREISKITKFQFLIWLHGHFAISREN